MSDIWDALRHFSSDLGTIGHLTWWFDWGVFVGLILVVAILIWTSYEARNQRQRFTLAQQLAIAALVLLLPSLYARLFPLSLLRLFGFDQDPASLYDRLIELLQGKWDPLEKLGQVKTGLLIMAIAGWVGTLGGIAAAALQSGLVGGKPGLVCESCGRKLDVSWEYCPYCTPPQQAREQPPLPIPLTTAIPPTVVEPPRPISSLASPAAPLPARTVAAGQRPAPVAWLVVRTGPFAGRQFQLSGVLTIGRAVGKNEIVLEDPQLSSQHVRLRQSEGRFTLSDLASTNGTFVNGQRVQRHMLMDGDCIHIGGTDLVFREVRG